MRKQVLAVAVACVVALALSGSLASAAGGIMVDIPFSFIVRDKEMPAGRYEIQPESGGALLKVRSAAGGGQVVASVIERLADIGGKQPKVVFDTVEGKHYLSEVHMPGSDGYLVGVAKGKETHEVVTGKE